MVRIGRILLDGERHVDGAVGLECQRRCLEILEGGRCLGDEVDVADQGDVLDGVRHAVERAVVGEGLDRDRGVQVGVGAEIDRGDHAVGDEFAEPVVGAGDDVGTLTGGAGDAELVADLIEWDLDHLDGDAFQVAELCGDRLEHGCPGVVGPDHEIGVATGGSLVLGGLGGGFLGCLGGFRGVRRLRALGGLGCFGGLGRRIARVVIAAAGGAHQGGYGGEGDQAA